MKNLLYLLLFSLFTNCEKRISIDKSNCASDSEVAVEIAEKEWIKVFGKKVLEKKPYNVTLKNNSVWIVEGTLPNGHDGGVPYIEINAKNCTVLKINHGK